jgi:hypothetical protein
LHWAPRRAYDPLVPFAALTRNATLFRDRERPMQILLGGVIPAAVGAIAGILVGVSVGAYYGLGALAAIGSFVAGFEHRDGWGGADRGFISGAIYGAALLLVHAAIGNQAKVSLGSFKPLFAVLTAIIGMFICAAGGRIARLFRERAGIFITDPDPERRSRHRAT